MDQTLDFDPHLSQLTQQRSSSDKKYEITVHFNKKTFRCLVNGCGKTFKFKSEMKRHLTIHSNERPYTCSVCEKTFKRADALGNHVKLHDKSLYFRCTVPQCDAKFQTKSSLQYHLLKHNNEKVFKCKFPGCTKSFITYAQLKQHEKAAYYHRKLIEMSSPSYTVCSTRNDEFISVSDEKTIENETYNEIEDLELNSFIENSIELGPEPNNFQFLENNETNFSYPNIQENCTNFNKDSFVQTSQVQSVNMDPNVVNMIQTILKENEDLKKRLEHTSSFLQTDSVQTSQDNYGFDVDKYLQISSDFEENKGDFQFNDFWL